MGRVPTSHGPPANVRVRARQGPPAAPQLGGLRLGRGAAADVRQGGPALQRPAAARNKKHQGAPEFVQKGGKRGSACFLFVLLLLVLVCGSFFLGTSPGLGWF